LSVGALKRPRAWLLAGEGGEGATDISWAAWRSAGGRSRRASCLGFAGQRAHPCGPHSAGPSDWEVLSWGGSSAAELCREMELMSIQRTEVSLPMVVLIQSGVAAVKTQRMEAKRTVSLLFGL